MSNQHLAALFIVCAMLCICSMTRSCSPDISHVAIAIVGIVGGNAMGAARAESKAKTQDKS